MAPLGTLDSQGPDGAAGTRLTALAQRGSHQNDQQRETQRPTTPRRGSAVASRPPVSDAGAD